MQIINNKDLTKQISRDYGVLLEDMGVALRGTFLIDENGTLVHSSINNLDVGRNMSEYLRIIDAIDHVKENGEVCPAQWKKKGDPTMKGDHSEDLTKEYWNKHFKVD